MSKSKSACYTRNVILNESILVLQLQRLSVLEMCWRQMIMVIPFRVQAVIAEK